jgi:hypothetical protein
VNPVNDADRGPALRRVRGVIERLVGDGTAVANSDGTVHDLFPVAVGAAEGEALRDWIVREQATRTIEVGLGYGLSALHICEGLLANAGEAMACHVAIDPYQARRFSGLGLQLLEEAGVAGIVEHHEEESQLALPRFLGEGRTFDVAFVDGNHRFDWVFVDLFYLGRLLRPGGSSSSMTTSCPASRARRCSTRRTWAGGSRRSRPRTTYTSGRYSALPWFRTRGRSTTSSSSDPHYEDLPMTRLRPCPSGPIPPSVLGLCDADFTA